VSYALQRYYGYCAETAVPAIEGVKLRTGNQFQPDQNQPGRVAAIIAIWTAAGVVGCFLIPNRDLFASYRYEPPDLLRQLEFRVLATTLMGCGLTYLFRGQLYGKQSSQA
jgi:hypothetical protein